MPWFRTLADPARRLAGDGAAVIPDFGISGVQISFHLVFVEQVENPPLWCRKPQVRACNDEACSSVVRKESPQDPRFILSEA